MVVHLTPEARWICNHCDFTDVTNDPTPHSRMHRCRGLKGMNVPMVPDGTKAKIETAEREDYINGDLVTTNTDGRPIAAAYITRDDGQDCVIYAPCATASQDDLD